MKMLQAKNHRDTDYTEKHRDFSVQLHVLRISVVNNTKLKTTL